MNAQQQARKAAKAEAKAERKAERRAEKAERKAQRQADAQEFVDRYKEEVKQKQAGTPAPAASPVATIATQQQNTRVSPQDAWREASKKNFEEYQAAKAALSPNSVAANRAFSNYEAAQARSWRDTGMSSLPGHAPYGW